MERKLAKASIEELQREMPVLGIEELRGISGGTIYVLSQATALMKIAILLFLSLFFTCVVQAQDVKVVNRDTLSISQLLENFTKKTSDIIPLCDFVIGFDESEISIFSYSPLKCITDIPLGKIRAEWLIKHNGIQSQLFLKKIIPIDFSKEKSKEIYSNLEKKYSKDAELGIPAKWFTGEIILLSCPKNSFGEIISKNGRVIKIKEGCVISQTAVNIKKGKWEKSFHVQEDGSVLIRGDGCWWSDIRMNTDSLNSFINRKMQCETKNTVKKEYSILLVIDSNSGTTHPYFLLPETINIEDKINTTYLKKRLEELPAWSYGPLLTLRGQLMYGRYFKATLSEKGWTLKDYILE